MFERAKRFGRGGPPADAPADRGAVATQEAGTTPPGDQATNQMPVTNGGRYTNGEGAAAPTRTAAPAGAVPAAGTASPAATATAGQRTTGAPVQERVPPRTRRAGVARDAVVLDREARLRQRERFGGTNWGSAFFGWLVAIGMGALLTAIVTATGAAVGLTTNESLSKNADTVGIVGGALLVAAALIAYFCGGYVAGRMSRFDGARQGFAVWLIGLVLTVLIAAAGWVFGDQYNVLQDLNLPRIPIHASDATTGGIIALVAIAVGSLLAAIFGGKAGERYHRRVDRAALVD